MSKAPGLGDWVDVDMRGLNCVFCVKRNGFASTVDCTLRFTELTQEGLKLFFLEVRMEERASLCIYYGARMLTFGIHGHTTEKIKMCED